MEKEKGKISVKILSESGKLYNDLANCVFVPTRKGEIAILPYHTSMICELSKGTIFVVESHHKKKIADIDKGLARVDDNQAVILVNL